MTFDDIFDAAFFCCGVFSLFTYFIITSGH